MNNEETLKNLLWANIEKHINKWFKVSPGLIRNLKSVQAKSTKIGYFNIVLNDKRGNVIILASDISKEFVLKYLSDIANLLGVLSSQVLKKVDSFTYNFL